MYLQYKEADSPERRAFRPLIEQVKDEPNTQPPPGDSRESEALPSPKDQPRLGSTEGDKVDPVHVEIQHGGDRQWSPM